MYILLFEIRWLIYKFTRKKSSIHDKNTIELVNFVFGNNLKFGIFVVIHALSGKWFQVRCATKMMFCFALTLIP
jgi:hypothetical protein